MQGNGIFSNLTFSEKRKIIIFLLLEKPCTLQEINEHLSVKSPESQPRIKEMESVGLVVKDEDGRKRLIREGKVDNIFLVKYNQKHGTHYISVLRM